MQELQVIEGSMGGKGGGGGHTPIEYDDTLHSKQVVRLLFLLSEGRIKSIQDILVNGTSISNYSDYITWQWRSGTLDQTVIKGFSQVEAPLTGAGTFPLALLYNVPHIFSIDGIVDSARVTLLIEKLMKVQDNGDRVGHSVSHSIYVRNNPQGGSPGLWFLITESTKTGKASSPYAYDIRVERPDVTRTQDTWEIQVIRTSANDPGDKFYSKSHVQQIITIVEEIKTYPGKAVLGVTIKDAAIFGNTIPEVRIKAEGMMVRLPTTYNPETRLYSTGVWNGSFKTYDEYTNNPAWLLYHSLINTTWGLGIPSTDVDLGSFYLLGKYCDTNISDGDGGTIPRYTVDMHFIQTENVPTYLMYLTNLCNANFSSNEFGQIKVVWDAPWQAVTKIVSNASVVDGIFNYSSNELETRFTLVNVDYANQDIQGDVDTASQDAGDPLVNRYGLQVSNIPLPGCSHKARAIAKARWAIWTNTIDTEIISYKQLFQGASYFIGERVDIMDSDNADDTSHHAIVLDYTHEADSTIITLDREIVLPNEAMTASFVLWDGTTVVERAISERAQTTNTVTIAGQGNLLRHTTIIFSGTTVVKRPVKVIRIDKEDDLYTITAVTHNEAKYAYIDNVGFIAKPNNSGHFVDFNRFTTPACTDFLAEEVFSTNGTIRNSHINVSWQWNKTFTEKYQATFRVSWNRDNQQFRTIDGLTVKEVDINNPAPGIYTFLIWAFNPFTGLSSSVLTGTYSFRVSPASSTLSPPINLYVSGTTAGLFDTPNCSLVWENPSVNNDKVDKLRRYVLEVRDFLTSELKYTTYITPSKVDNSGRYNFLYNLNESIFGTAQRQFRIKVYCQDLMGDLSTGTELICENAVPGVVTFSVLSGLGQGFVSITIPNERDIAGYLIYRSLINNFTPTAFDIAYSGPDNYVSLGGAQNTTYYYRVAAYDSFGKTGLNISGQITSITLTSNAITWAKTGIVFTPNSPSTNVVSWTSGTVLQNGTTTYNINSGQVTWTTGILYIYFNPGINTTTLQTTTNLGTAVQMGSYPLATYQGGTNIKGGDGSAFVSGSQLIAGTVGAAQLVAGSAVITGQAQIANSVLVNSHLQDATIDFGKISDTLQSTNYSSTLHTGWRFTKPGNFFSYSGFTLFNSAGNVIVSNNGINGLYILNASIGTAAINDASITTLKVAGQAFSFMLAQQTTTLSAYVAQGAAGSFATIASFTAPIEYSSLLTYSFDGDLLVTSSNVTQYDLYLSIRRNSDSRILFTTLFGSVALNTFGAAQTINLGSPIAVTSTAQSVALTRVTGPSVAIPGTGNTNNINYSILIHGVRTLGTGTMSIRVGRALTTLSVLKR